jgi:hypothetical protein
MNITCPCCGNNLNTKSNVDDTPTCYYILDTSELLDRYYAFFESEVPPHVNKKTIIIDSVKKEVSGHLKSSDSTKAAKSRKARAYIAEIMADSKFLEINEKEIKMINLKENIIGIDSFVDRLIVSLAINLVDNNPKDIVYVATNDGGIQTELAKWRSDGKRVFTRSTLLNLKYLLLEEWKKFPYETVKLVYGIGLHECEYTYNLPRILTASECFEIMEKENTHFKIIA